MPFQILSLSGGGYRGLYTIAVLTEPEQHIRKPVLSCFDLVAGTSVGGIIALGLAAGRQPYEIKEAFEKNGARIFSDRPAPTSRLGRYRNYLRSALKPKYDGVALREIISDLAGEETLLGELACPVIVPSVNLTTGRPQVFKTPHHRNFQRDYRLKVVDVAMATSAAPTYFPVAQIGDELFADGGLYANSPDLMAIHEAEHFFETPTQDIHLLSIGTTTSTFSLPRGLGLNLGYADWAERLASVVNSAQQASVDDIVGHKLRERYVRIDELQTPEQMESLGLDVATEGATGTMRAMASGSVRRMINDPMLKQMLRSQRLPQKFSIPMTRAVDNGRGRIPLLRCR